MTRTDEMDGDPARRNLSLAFSIANGQQGVNPIVLSRMHEYAGTKRTMTYRIPPYGSRNPTNRLNHGSEGDSAEISVPGTFVHNIDPIIADIAGIHLWWYGMSCTPGFPGIFIWFRRARRRLDMSMDDV